MCYNKIERKKVYEAGVYMVDISKPHNNLFLKTMESEEAVREFLELNLPEKIIEKFKMETLRNTGNSYVTDELKELFSDIVYKVDFMDGETGYVSCLLEHKSSPERKTVFQLHKYMTRIWDKELKNNDKGILPVIVPILFYHGDTDWRAPRKLSGLMEGNIEWAENIIPDFEYYLYTFSDLVDKIPYMTVPKLKIYIKALRVPRSKTPEEFFKRFTEFWKETNEYVKKTGEEVILRYSYRYIVITTDRELASGEEIEKKAKEITPERSDFVDTIAQDYIERGREEGEKEGIIMTLTRQLENILETEIPEEIKQKMEEKSRDKLIEIGANIIEINSIKDLRNELEK